VRQILRLGLLLFVPALLHLTGCGPSQKEKPRPNLILVIIDALRNDHLSCYGYDRPTTPFLDSQAAGGLLFENCVAQAPWTAASMASLFTSRYPTQIGVGALEDSTGWRHVMKLLASGLDEDEMTLAEMLSIAGYQAAAVTANLYVSDKWGTAQGFDSFIGNRLTADKIVDAAFDQLSHLAEPAAEESREARRPFFLYLHFMDVHAPNRPPEPYYTMYPTLDSAPHTRAHEFGGSRIAMQLEPEDPQILLSHKIALYDGALTFVDAQIKRFVDHLHETGLLENSVIVIAADHGEGLLDHGLGMGHGFSMYREQLEVPLIIFGAGVPSGRIKPLVRNLDITPTLLGLAGIDVTGDIEDVGLVGVDLEGVDLLQELSENRLQGLFAYSEDMAYQYEKKSLQDDRYKYIKNIDGEAGELLFDKSSDPLELEDLSQELDQVAAEYRAKLARLIEGIEAKKRQGVMMDEKTKKELRALGY